jgi:putative redox protein
VQVDWAGDYVFLGDDGLGHTIVFDSSQEGPGKGISPMKALLACVAACSGMDVVAILGKRNQKLTSLKVQVSGERPEHGYPKPYTSISLKYIITGESLEEKYVEEAVRDSMEKFCSVAATVSGTAKIDHSYEIVED